MYAGKIRLVSTEQGVGVNNAGQIYASAGNVEITANGLVANSGKIAASDTVAVSAQALQNSGAMYAQNRANIVVQNGVQNSGGIYSQNGSSIQAPGAVENSGVIASSGSVDINAGSFSQSAGSTLVSGIDPQDMPWSTPAAQPAPASKALTVRTAGDFASAGTIASGDTISVVAGSNISVSGSAQSLNDQYWEAANLDLSKSRMQSGGDISLVGRNGGITTSGASIAANNIGIQAQGLVNDAGLILTQNSLNINLGSGTLANLNSGSSGDLGLIANGALNITAQTLNNNGGFLTGTPLTLNISNLDNTGGTIFTSGDFTLSLPGAFSNDGTIQSGGVLSLSAASFNQGASGTLASGGDMNLITPGTFASAGTMSSGGNITVQAGSSITMSGQAASQGSQSWTGTAITVSGQVASGGDQSWIGNTLNLAGSQIQSGGNILFQGLQGVAVTSGAQITAQNIDLRAAGQTTLIGGVIASSQKAVDDKLNYFSTKGLTIADLENVSKYDASSSTTTVSVGYDSGGGGIRNSGIQIPGGSAVNLGASEDNTSTSLSGISAGTIIVGGKQITPNDDGQYIVNGQVLNTAVVTGGDSGHIDNSLDLKKINSEFAIGTALSQEMTTGLSNLGKDYPDAFGEGKAGRLVLTALAGAMEGNLSGSATDLLGSTAASVIQGLGAAGVKELLSALPEGDPETGLIRAGLQGILGCAAGAVQGGNCASGALGAAASVVMNDLVSLANGQSVSQLSQAEKDKITSTIASLTGSIAGALGGNAGVASLAAQIESENNAHKSVGIVINLGFLGLGGTLGVHYNMAHDDSQTAPMAGQSSSLTFEYGGGASASAVGGAIGIDVGQGNANDTNQLVGKSISLGRAGLGEWSAGGSTTLDGSVQSGSITYGPSAGYIGASGNGVKAVELWSSHPTAQQNWDTLNQSISTGIGRFNSCLQTNTCGD